MTRVYQITSENGDEYKISLSQNDWLNLSGEIKEQFGLDLISIELMRVSGNAITSSRTLATIEQLIADEFFSNPEAILFYYCDFLNPIPATSKKLLPQEYRSRLFSDMLQRYISQHNIQGFSEVVTVVEGIDEPYYFHLICRDHHLAKVQQIASKLQADFSK